MSTGPAAIGPALSALRAATRHQHDELDRSMPLAAPEAGAAELTSHLRLMLVWMAPLEAMLGGCDDGPQGTSAPPRRLRTPLLLADLAEPTLAGFEAGQWSGDPRRMGHRAAVGSASDGDGVPRPMCLATDRARRWGIGYVLEGAQLGGWVLAQRLQGRLPGHPLRYLRGEGSAPATASRWRAYVQAMEADLSGAEKPEEAISAACEGAVQAFEQLLGLCRQSRHPVAPAACHA